MVALALEEARERVRPLIEAERESERVTSELLTFHFGPCPLRRLNPP